MTVKCRTFFIPRKFTAIIIMAVHIPSQANTKAALVKLHSAISNQLTMHPDMAGDFNHSELKTIFP